MLQSRIKSLVFLLLLFSVLGSNAQIITTDSVSFDNTDSISEFPFINFEGDSLINADHLAPFFEKLFRLEDCDSNQISILHIGDSHIQADYLTREVRKNFQLRFGNAGRGLVFPLKVADTNEPADYHSTTNTSWAVAKINSSARTPEPGVSGISISSGENGANFDVSTYNHDDLDYSFSQVTLIHTKDSLQFDCRFSDAPSKFGYLMSAKPSESGENSTSVQFMRPTNFVRIQAEQTEVGQQSITINGLILQNSNPGVVYHSVGINGAHFSDYNSSPLFFRQVKMLKPDLIIISLGTNEGANIKVTTDEIILSVENMIQSIRSVSPDACILITTPADDFFRKKYKNPYLEAVQRGLLKSTDLEGVACWDLYSISGGYGSAGDWRKAGMLQRDGVHFNKQGYTLQGSLLYKALIDSYQRYAEH